MAADPPYARHRRRRARDRDRPLQRRRLRRGVPPPRRRGVRAGARACSGSVRSPRRWCRRSSSGSGSTRTASTSRAARSARSCSWTRTRAASTGSGPTRGGATVRSAAPAAEIVTDYDVDLEAYDLDVAEQVREAMATLSDGERQRHRARLLRRAHVPRGGADPRTAGGDHQEPDTHRADAAARRSCSTGESTGHGS